MGMSMTIGKGLNKKKVEIDNPYMQMLRKQNRLVEIKIDLTDSMSECVIEVYEMKSEVMSTSGHMLHTKSKKIIGKGKVFPASELGIINRSECLKYNYLFKTGEEDCKDLYNSEIYKNSITKIKDKIQKDLDFYQKKLNNV